MKKVMFEERKGIRKYILHNSIPTPINVVDISEDGMVKTDTGEILDPPFYPEKGEINAYKLEGKWYKIEEEIGVNEEHMGPWDEDQYLYDKGMVVTLEGTEDEKDYIFDGWCNLYRRPNGEKGTLADDCHPLVGGRNMTLSQAIDKLFFVESVDYPYYLDCLWGQEIYEEQEELNQARQIFSESGLDYDEVIAKKRERQANHVPEPIRFIDKVHFIPVETDDLPF